MFISGLGFLFRDGNLALLQNTHLLLPASVSSTDKRLNKEQLYKNMPVWRRHGFILGAVGGGSWGGHVVRN